jgi:hypothetical protein
LRLSKLNYIMENLMGGWSKTKVYELLNVIGAWLLARDVQAHNDVECNNMYGVAFWH